MDWSKTKTIFILVFFILNMFLLYQYVEKKSVDDYEFIEEASFEERLKENDITFTTLPKQTSKEQYISAKSKHFTEDDLKKLKNQDPKRFNEQRLFSKLDKPFLLGEEIHSEALDTFVKENVLYGEEYKFWKVNEFEDTVVYYQTYKDKMIYNNSNAMLELTLNGNREIISYQQTYLENIEEFDEENQEEVIKAIDALKTLFEKGYIQPKSEITEVELGYINLLQYTASHVLTPTWHVVVNKKEDLYVNALDGKIIDIDTEPDVSEGISEPEKQTENDMILE